ncbi:MAG: hypothetical protein U0350_04315 [Caldilineaceae bacterium]
MFGLGFLFCFFPLIIFMGLMSLFFRPFFWGWRRPYWHHRHWGYRHHGWRRRGWW